MLDKELFKQKVMRNSICLLILLLVVFSASTLSKYINEAHGLGEAEVAKWQNNLELLQDELIIDASKGKKVSFKFNVSSDSQVSSKYSLNFKNVPLGIGLSINDSNHTKKVIIDNNNITISFDDTSALFNKNTNATINDISYTLTKEADKEILLFINQKDNTSISVELENNLQSITFNDWEVIKPESMMNEFNGEFEVLADEYLISSSDIIASAIFEQID